MALIGEIFSKLGGVVSLGRLLSLAAIGGTVASAAAINRLVTQLVGIIALTVLASIMLGVFVVTLLYTLYVVAVGYGIAPLTALLCLSGSVLVLTLIIFWLLLNKLKGVKSTPNIVVYPEIPLVDQVQTVAAAFVDGFKKGKKEDTSTEQNAKQNKE